MASIWPTAEGQIAWTEHLAPPRFAKFLRYHCGWMCALGSCFFSAASAFVWSTLVVAFASIANPTYVNERWHTTLICIATLIFSLLTNIYCVRWFGVINYATAALGAATLVVVRSSRSRSLFILSFELTVGSPSTDHLRTLHHEP